MKNINLFVLFTLLASFWACKPLPELGSTGNGGTQASTNSSSSAAMIIIPKKKKVEDAVPTVSIEWLSPTSADLLVKNVGGKVEMKVRISSQTPISLDQIDILVNGKPAGNKAGEVGLMRRPEFKDQILTAQVPVSDGTNDVQVVVAMAGDQRFFSERTLEKGSAGVKVLQSVQSTTGTRVIWTQPDAFALKANEMFNTSVREMEIRFNISSPERIDKSQIQVLVNKVYKSPSPIAELKGENGSYYFKDVVTLQEDLPFNEVGLRVNAPTGPTTSQLLKVNFSPLRPNLYLLSIGTQTNLKYTVKDARDFAGIFSGQGRQMFRIFNTVTVDTLLGNKATTSEIRGSIESIKNKFKTGSIGPDDIVMLFISSHGFIDDLGDFRIQGDDYKPERRLSTSVSYKNDILTHLESLPCKKLVFIDACHSGGQSQQSRCEQSPAGNKRYCQRARGIYVQQQRRRVARRHCLGQWRLHGSTISGA
ncbi:MAG: caspase family protein [Lewinellaceae bacterium]|nr:caspase family protein [Lewinellaceae bacterium]